MTHDARRLGERYERGRHPNHALSGGGTPEIKRDAGQSDLTHRKLASRTDRGLAEFCKTMRTLGPPPLATERHPKMGSRHRVGPGMQRA